MKFKKGDIIVPNDNSKIIRRIVEVKDNYYLWEYPDLTPHEKYNLFDSRNSNDSTFEWWDKVVEET